MTTTHDRGRGATEHPRQPSYQRLHRSAFLVLGVLVACGPAELDGEISVDFEDDSSDESDDYTTKITQGTRITGYPSVGYLTVVPPVAIADPSTRAGAGKVDWGTHLVRRKLK